MPTDKFHREIAKVESAHLGYEDHGIFTLMLGVTFGSGGQGIGGYALDNPGEDGRRGTAYGMEFIIRTMRACGVEEWSKVVGRTIYVLRDGEDKYNAKVVGIEPLPTEKGERFMFDEIKEMAGV
jgi:hypothetical protein